MYSSGLRLSHTGLILKNNQSSTEKEPQIIQYESTTTVKSVPMPIRAQLQAFGIIKSVRKYFAAGYNGDMTPKF